MPTARCASEPLPITVAKPPRNIGIRAIAPISTVRYSGTSSARQEMIMPASTAERASGRPGSRRHAYDADRDAAGEREDERDVERDERVDEQRELERRADRSDRQHPQQLVAAQPRRQEQPRRPEPHDGEQHDAGGGHVCRVGEAAAALDAGGRREPERDRPGGGDAEPGEAALRPRAQRGVVVVLARLRHHPVQEHRVAHQVSPPHPLRLDRQSEDPFQSIVGQ